MTTILRALRRLWHWLFRREKELPAAEVERVPEQAAPTEAERVPPWRQRIPLLGRIVQTSRRDLPNAPKKQPCSSCAKWVKRTRKTLRLAFYYCNRCKVETRVYLRG